MMQDPPLPPGLSFTPPQGEPALPPGLSYEPPQARNPARPAPSPQRQVSAPQRMQQAAPAASGGLSREDRIGGLLDQGYTPDEAIRLADEQIAYEGGAPSPLAGQGVGEPYTPQGQIGTQDNPIDLTRPLMADEVPLLVQGTYVRGQNGEVYALPGDAFAASPRSSDEAQGNGVYIRRPNTMDRVDAFTQAAGEQIPFLDEAAAAAAGAITGRGYDAMRDQQELSRRLQNQTDRGPRVAGGLAGFATSLAAPGGAFIGRGGTIANRALRGLGVGGATGSVYGAGAADDGLANRAAGFGQGLALGAGVGAAAPVAGAAASATGRLIGRTAGRMVDAALDRPQNPQVAQREAVNALQRALQGDGVDAATANRITQEWLASGVTPNLIDVVPRGGQTQRLLRGAAVRSGPAATAAEGYLDNLSGQLQDRAMNLTRGLTPEQRPADEVVQALRQGRTDQAEIDYRGPYQDAVPVDDTLISALSDEPGRAALRRARAAAVSRRAYDQVAEIDALLGDAPPQTVSAATLDRARIAMGGRGRNLMTGSSARPDVAGGLFDRANDIDGALDAVPALQPARETYRRFSDGIEGVDIGQTVRSADPDRLAAQLANREGAQFTAPVGAARSLESAIGTPAEGATGLLNRIATGPNIGRNLGTIFGKETGDRYRAGIGNLVDQLNNARFAASSTGSQTIGRAADLVDPITIPQGPVAALMMAIDKIRRGVQLTEAESEILVSMGQRPINGSLFGGGRNRVLSGYTVPSTAALLGTTPY